MKLVIGSLVIFSLVLLFLFALFPSDVSVSRVIRIRNSRAIVYRKIADLRNWEWNDLLYDSIARPVSYAKNEVDSNYIHLPVIQVDLLKAVPDTVVTRWRHGNKSFMGIFILKERDGLTDLEWTLRFHVKWYPWDKMASMFYEKQIGPEVEKSLLHLRKEMEYAK
ncbi:MAG TPA: hypothetical protein VIL90_05965 [Puia sp.]